MRPLLVCHNGQGIVGVTLSHEFTHFIQEWSPEKFKVLGDYVIRRFNESNVNVDALVRTQMEKAKRARGEVLSYDEAYRRGLFGIVGTAKKGSGVSIDQMWNEASEMFPTYFSEDIVNAEDQAERLYYLAQSLKRSNYFTNVYEQNIDAAAYDMMLQIGAKYLDVPQSKTFADKFAEKLEAARKASRDTIRQKAAELRAQQKTANRTEKRLDAKITQMARVMAQIEARADSYETQLKTERKAAEARVKAIRTENAQEKQKLAEEYRRKNREKLCSLTRKWAAANRAAVRSLRCAFLF